MKTVIVDEGWRCCRSLSLWCTCTANEPSCHFLLRPRLDAQPQTRYSASVNIVDRGYISALVFHHAFSFSRQHARDKGLSMHRRGLGGEANCLKKKKSTKLGLHHLWFNVSGKLNQHSVVLLLHHPRLNICCLFQSRRWVSDPVSPSRCSRPSFLLKQAKALHHIPLTVRQNNSAPFTAQEMMPPFCASHGKSTGVLLWRCGGSLTPFC